MRTDGKREYGDVQTPDALAFAVARHLRERGVRPARILEPTCGAGAFLRAARAAFGDTPALVGVELRDDFRPALAPLGGPRTTLVFADAAHADFGALLRAQGDGHALVLGNLPWVTTDALTRMDAGPGPRRGNPTALRGLDARTGAGAFDVAEYLALRLFEALVQASGDGWTFAMLLKASVARRLLRELRRRSVAVSRAAVTLLDARREFGVGADAVLLEIDGGPKGTPLTSASVSERLGAQTSQAWHIGDEVVAGDRALATGDGNALDWRQGIKHDAAAIFELTYAAGAMRNGRGEPVDVEDEAVFPLVRARDLARGAGHDGASYLLVPYRDLREGEDLLRARTPRVHAYLERHADALAARRSSIYRNAARFAIFGVGPYAFAPHKVAVSGLHREPCFVVLSGSKPLQLGDTAYAAGFDAARDAHAFAALLNAAPARAALRSAIFPGKRPVTKRLLARLDLRALLDRPDVASVGEAAARRLRELLADGPRGPA